MANKYKNDFFEFNLIPPKSKQEIEVLVERDNSIQYSIILLCVGVLIFAVLAIINGVFVQQRLQASNLDVQTTLDKIATFDPIKKTHGELFIKSETLEPILSKDIKIIDLINASKQITQNINGAVIFSYTRDTSGNFAINFTIANFTDASKMIENAKAVNGISNVFLNSVIRESSTENKFDGVISFTLNNLSQSNGQ